MTLHVIQQPRTGKARIARWAVSEESTPISAAWLLALLGATSLLLQAPISFLAPRELVMPWLSISAFALAALLAGVAVLTERGRSRARLSVWDLSGLLTFVGCGAAMLSEPHAVVDAFMGSRR